MCAWRDACAAAGVHDLCDCEALSSEPSTSEVGKDGPMGVQLYSCIAEPAADTEKIHVYTAVTAVP